MSHPILRQLKFLYLYLAAWLIVAVSHALILRLNLELAVQWAVLDSFVFNVVYAALGLTIWYSSRYISLENEPLRKIFGNHLFASLFLAGIWLGLCYLMLSRALRVDAGYLEFLENSMAWRILLGVLFYFVLAAFYYVFIYSTNLAEQRSKEAELKALVNQAELKSLKFQINPHFIFNSLNSINSLTQTDAQKAGVMTVKLADFLRYTLSNNERQKNTLGEELNSARLYLDIEKVRFGNKFEYTEEIDSGCLDYPMPNMILQPLLENAIKHGVYESLETVAIRFKCNQNGEFLRIEIENDFDPDGVASRGEGIGLENIRNRLAIMYDQKNLLEVSKNAGVFKVNIYIPLVTKI